MGKWMTIDNKRSLVRKNDSDTVNDASRHNCALLRNTVSDILKNASAILKDEYGKGKRHKPLKVRAPRLEKRLRDGVKQAEKRGLSLNRKVITRKAQKLRYEVGGPALDVGLSVGWLSAFLNRHDLRHRARHGEAGSAAFDTVRCDDPKDVYNMDETGLNYKAAPACSICRSRTPGVKKDKTRITLALSTNGDGSDSLPVLFIGRAEKPRCFEKRTGKEHGFLYRKTDKAWMNSKVYQEWLVNLDREIRSAGRHILLLVDNVSSHARGNVVLTNVKVEKLPPNTTTYLQPLDAGIIASFKAGFK
ncbi:Tigger transposable element-derived protein 6 [Phytophthora megakarya]|uniref:Tigger transposable element-derived protein 6 n=1 Tax=Phytophthora megakarya TaxID=4795 RepID=A0A225VJ76_9STRA|nr:Tigger transposable element-derived protein 6 [Phytophthora megakarya]